jgi:hypothetical protein
MNQLGASFGQKIGVSNCNSWNGEVKYRKTKIVF